MTQQLLLVLGSIALLDSTSIVPLCVVPLATILGGNRPILSSTAFLMGVFIVYLCCGLLLLAGFDALFQIVGAELAQRWKHPDTLDLLLQVTLGSVMIAFAWKLANTRQTHGEHGATGSMAPGQSFILGSVLTVIGLPGAFPYFGAIDQILRVGPKPTVAAITLVFYNLMFILPLVCLIIMKVYLGKASDLVFQRVAQFSELWGRRLIVSVLFLVGIALLVDGLGWFLGYPMLPVG